MSPPAAGTAATSGEAPPPSPRELYTIPASSGWFRWDGIHETERQALPEFFGGVGGAGFGTATRNPRIYREYRDFIIGKYREDPARRLTFTEVRRALVGDVTLLRKLFAFLDASGLINFSATSSCPAGQQQEAGVVVEAPVGLQVTPRPPASYFAEEKRGRGGENGFRLPPLTSYSDVFGEWAPGKAPICGYCGEGCNYGEFETMEDGVKVCFKCSKTNNDNKEKAIKCAGDKKESADNHASSSWTDAETLLLLEGVLKHGDDWDLIAQHVRTKNKSECIARLIQLPFGEHMLGTINGKSVSGLHMNQTTDGKMNQHIMKESSSQSTELADGMQIDGDEDSADKSAEEHPTKRKRLFPSMDATTSLMEQLALLTTATSPDVLAAAADAAIKALGNENPQAKKAFHLSEREYKNKAFSSNHVQQIDCRVGNQDAEMHVQTVTDKKQTKQFIATAYQVRAAVATAIGVAAARAKMLADQEEREMELLMASIIETQLRKIQYKIKHFEELELIMEQEYTTIQQIKGSLIDEWLKVLEQAFQSGVSLPRDEVLMKLFLNKTTGHELPEREKEAYARSRACRLALIDHAVARKKPPLNAFMPHTEHKSKLVCNITGDTINKSEEHIWKHINGKRFLSKLEQLEEKMASGEMAEGEATKSNEVVKKSKSSSKDKKKATVVSPSLPREPKPEMDDSDDADFWVPPVGSRWDDDDGKDRWESSPGKNDAAENEGAFGGGGGSGGGGDDDMADKDDAESRELASSRAKRMSLEAVGPSSFASRKKKPKKDQ
ncbi:SWI/SNF complex subunit SWI3A homolog [Phragmites australis]|uniref:SWI/SNF complex subunit SWI3A homolog n=1 Tax=Phragmites australis TaxID=29695 RepID=UPI002D771B8A|nr:SWI/SNF complex subunit SWI3A homolog [Phragmites australis]